MVDIVLNILLLASLSFLGLGVQPPTPEWGADDRRGPDATADRLVDLDAAGPRRSCSPASASASSATASPTASAAAGADARRERGDDRRPRACDGARGRAGGAAARGPEPHTAFAGSAGLGHGRGRRRASRSGRARRWGSSASRARGKSVTLLLAARARAASPARVVDGEVAVRRARPARAAGRASCGDSAAREIAMIFQDPTSSPQPGLHDRRADRRDAAGQARHGRPRPRATAPPSCSTASASPSAERRGSAYPHELSRRHAPARDDRDRDRLPPAAAARRRADDRARRDDPGPDPRAARRAPAGARDGDGARLARPRRRSRRTATRSPSCTPGTSSSTARRGALRARRATRTRARCCRRCRRSQSPGRATRLRADRAASRPTSPQLPAGCPFRPRCPSARDACAEVTMELAARRRRRTSPPARSRRRPRDARCSSVDEPRQALRAAPPRVEPARRAGRRRR